MAHGPDGAGGHGAERAPLRVVLIEDHGMVADAFGRVLRAEPDLDLVDVAGSAVDGVLATARHRPDVVMSDLRLGDGSIIEHLGQLRRRSPASHVLIVTGAPTEKAMLDAFEQGAIGFLSKARPVDELLDAVRRVAHGEVVVSPDLSSVLLARLDRRCSTDRRTLTRRELEVLQQLAQGASTDGIASTLCLSSNTVRNHIARAMLKLRAHTRLQAVSEATRHGLISPY